MIEFHAEPKSPVDVSQLVGGCVARVALRAGRGNVLTREVIRELDRAFEQIGDETMVRAVVLVAEGRDFSFGASVREHAPDQVGAMLPAFHRLFRTIAKAAVPVCVAVQGRCLGGAFELALAAHRVIASEDANVGLPEVTLGVFPPVAAALLPLRVPQPVVDRLVVLGDVLPAREALANGVIDAVVPAVDLEEQALIWATQYVKLSGVAVRYATRAARAAWDEALGARLERLEKLYLGDLMATDDAREGISAFLERREPVWRDR